MLRMAHLIGLGELCSHKVSLVIWTDRRHCAALGYAVR